MENKELPKNIEKQPQVTNIVNRRELMISGVEKMISVKPDLLQVQTSLGTLQVIGKDMEVVKLNVEQKTLEVKGLVISIRYLDEQKIPLLKRIFK